jgi:hypothetical protein
MLPVDAAAHEEATVAPEVVEQTEAVPRVALAVDDEVPIRRLLARRSSAADSRSSKRNPAPPPSRLRRARRIGLADS